MTPKGTEFAYMNEKTNTSSTPDANHPLASVSMQPAAERPDPLSADYLLSTLVEVRASRAVNLASTSPESFAEAVYQMRVGLLALAGAR